MFSGTYCMLFAIKCKCIIVKIYVEFLFPVKCFFYLISEFSVAFEIWLKCLFKCNDEHFC